MLRIDEKGASTSLDGPNLTPTYKQVRLRSVGIHPPCILALLIDLGTNHIWTRLINPQGRVFFILLGPPA